MQIKINIKQIIGVFLIYFALLWNQTNVSEVYLKNYMVPVAILFLGFLFIKSRQLTKWIVLCCGILFAFVVLLRLSVGGIGLEAFFNIVVLIVVAAYAVAYNKEHFFTRFLNVVVFLALISVIFWAFCWFFPKVYESIAITYETKMTYKIYSTSTLFKEYNYKASGLFIYVMREVDMRNTGIFTEPGVYQMVLNSALFVLLALDKYLHNISTKTKKVYFFIIIVALLTTQSTTGYIGGCLIILFYILSANQSIFAERKAVFSMFVVVILGLLIDYYIRGDSSLMSVAVLEKLMTNSNELSLSADASGTARLGAIFVSLKSIMSNPFGVGYDNFSALLNVEKTGYVAAAVLSFGAVWGIIPLAFVLWWIFYPIAKSDTLRTYKVLFVLLYFNTCLAQSNVFYPSLIIISLALFYERKMRRLQEINKEQV